LRAAQPRAPGTVVKPVPTMILSRRDNTIVHAFDQQPLTHCILMGL
jgi:hypothetical protein